MKKNRIIKVAMAAAVISSSVLSTSCSEDAPSYSHQISDLNGEWQWETKSDSDIADYFQVNIVKTADDEIKIYNFHNLSNDECMTVKVATNNTLTFSGELAGGECKVSNGTGTITNGWETIRLKYEFFDGEETQNVEAELNEGKQISKNQVAK